MYPYIFTHCIFDEHLTISVQARRLRVECLKFPEMWAEVHFTTEFKCYVVGCVPDFMRSPHQLMVTLENRDNLLAICVRVRFSANDSLRYSCATHYPNHCHCLGKIVDTRWLFDDQFHVFTVLLSIEDLAELFNKKTPYGNTYLFTNGVVQNTSWPYSQRCIFSTRWRFFFHELPINMSSSTPFRTVAYSSNLPACLCNRQVTGHFMTTSALARKFSIMPGTPYDIRFSPTNNTYMFTVGDTSTLGTYTWTHATTFLESSGGLPDTIVAVLTLTPRNTSDPISGEVRASNHTVATFISPLGVATFNISDAT